MLHEKVKSFCVVEDNGGGLFLFVFSDADRNHCIYAGTDYEYRPGSLMMDLFALLAGDYPPIDWESNTDDPDRLWSELTNGLDVRWRNGINTVRIIAQGDNDNVTLHRMGMAGSLALLPDGIGNLSADVTLPMFMFAVYLRGLDYQEI